MDLKDTILARHSKSQTNKIIKWVGNSQQRFDELMKYFLSNDKIISQRAGWPMSYIACAHPNLVYKHLGKMLKNLQQPGLHDAVKRNTVRVLEGISITQRLHGQVMNTCFSYISSPTESAAVKAYSIAVLQKLAKQYPEIMPELKTIIEDRWEFETAAFRSRGKKVLKGLLTDN